MMDVKLIPGVLRELRKKKSISTGREWSQGDVAKAVGLTRRQIARLENDHNEPPKSRKKRELLAEVLGVTHDDIFKNIGRKQFGKDVGNYFSMTAELLGYSIDSVSLDLRVPRSNCFKWVKKGVPLSEFIRVATYFLDQLIGFRDLYFEEKDKESKKYKEIKIGIENELNEKFKYYSPERCLEIMNECGESGKSLFIDEFNILSAEAVTNFNRNERLDLVRVSITMNIIAKKLSLLQNTIIGEDQICATSEIEARLLENDKQVAANIENKIYENELGWLSLVNRFVEITEFPSKKVTIGDMHELLIIIDNNKARHEKEKQKILKKLEPEETEIYKEATIHQNKMMELFKDPKSNKINIYEGFYKKLFKGELPEDVVNRIKELEELLKDIESQKDPEEAKYEMELWKEHFKEEKKEKEIDVYNKEWEKILKDLGLDF